MFLWYQEHTYFIPSTNKKNNFFYLKKCGFSIATKSKNFLPQQNGWGVCVLVYQCHCSVFWVTRFFNFLSGSVMYFLILKYLAAPRLKAARYPGGAAAPRFIKHRFGAIEAVPRKSNRPVDVYNGGVPPCCYWTCSVSVFMITNIRSKTGQGDQM
jgi:hypothetical protein